MHTERQKQENHINGTKFIVFINAIKTLFRLPNLLAFFAIVISVATCRINNKQVLLAEKSNGSSVDTSLFNRLLYKQDSILTKDSTLISLSEIQIDSMISLNKQNSRIATAMEQQYYLNVSINNKSIYNSISNKIDQYNNVIGMANKLITNTLKLRVLKLNLNSGNHPSNEYIYNCLSSFESIITLLPNKYELLLNDSVRHVWTNCQNSIMHTTNIYKMIVDNSVPNSIDTTLLWNDKFEKILTDIEAINKILFPYAITQIDSLKKIRNNFGK
jgi:hypothetical protein